MQTQPSRPACAIATLTSGLDNKGGVDAKLEGRRYFCNQCHVAQADAKPLVENTFRASASNASSDADRE